MVQWLTLNEFLEAQNGRIGRFSVYERIHDNSIAHICIGRKF